MAAGVPTGLKFVKGGPINLAEEMKKGNRVFVFEFWATWCPPCRRSIPHLSELQQKYKDSVVFVGITSEDEQTATAFVNQMGSQMDYPVAIDSGNNASSLYMAKYGVQGIPHAFIVGKDGNVAWHGHPMDGGFESSLRAAVAVPDKVNWDPKSMTEEQLLQLPVKELKEWLRSRNIDHSACVEKTELVQLIKSKM